MNLTEQKASRNQSSNAGEMALWKECLLEDLDSDSQILRKARRGATPL